jgi:hypothetical protein
MKITTALAVAAGLAGLAACQQTPQANNVVDNMALNESANVEMTANAMNEAMPVGNEANAVDTNAGGDTTANNTTTNTY